MNVGVILYHKNALKIYEQSWINQCINSIKDQTFQDFVVFEMDYGGTGKSFYPKASVTFNDHLPTYADAMNWLLDYSFGCDIDFVFNVNLDDYYAPERFDHQLNYLKEGADLVSSFFEFVDVNGNNIATCSWDDLDVAKELHNEQNVICHPSVAYSRNFWENCSRYNPTEVPMEDLRLWQREVGNFNFQVVPEILTFCRYHHNNASHNEAAR